MPKELTFGMLFLVGLVLSVVLRIVLVSVLGLILSSVLIVVHNRVLHNIFLRNPLYYCDQYIMIYPLPEILNSP